MQESFSSNPSTIPTRSNPARKILTQTHSHLNQFPSHPTRINRINFTHHFYTASFFSRRVISELCQFCIDDTFPRIIHFLWLLFAQSVFFAWHQFFTGAIFYASRHLCTAGFFFEFDKFKLTKFIWIN